MKLFREARLIFVLAGICLLMLIAMCIILSVTGKPEAPHFTPPEFDASAVQGTPSVPTELGWYEVYKEGMSFRASVCGEIILNDGAAKVYFTNPKGNNLWLKLRILNEDGEILAETGLIKPGEYVSEISFTTLPASGERLVLKLMSYQPETYYSGGSVTLTTVAK